MIAKKTFDRIKNIRNYDDIIHVMDFYVFESNDLPCHKSIYIIIQYVKKIIIHLLWNFTYHITLDERMKCSYVQTIDELLLHPIEIAKRELYEIVEYLYIQKQHK